MEIKLFSYISVSLVLKESLEYSQKKVLTELINQAKGTAFGLDHDFKSIKNVIDFKNKVPIGNYTSHAEYWGDFNNTYKSTWPGDIILLAKTSGTNGGAKHIPIMKPFMQSNQKSFVTYMKLLHNCGLISIKDLLFRKAFFIGSQAENMTHLGYTSENMSAFALSKSPKWIKNRIVPNIDDLNGYKYQDILNYICEHSSKWKIYGISGFPSWMTQVISKLKKHHNINTIHELWPHLKFYMYSGLSIQPYIDELKLSLGDIPILETFVSTEGFFGYQLPNETGMRLNLNAGIYYEFYDLETKQFDENPIIKKRYELVVSTNNGLWRYATGDCIKFISNTNFLFDGRISDIINVIGELIVSEQIRSMVQELKSHLKSPIKFISILPIKNNNTCKQYWFVATDCKTDLGPDVLDHIICKYNITYESYRVNNKGMDRAELIQCNEQVFLDYLSSKNKLNAQSKIPLVLPLNDAFFIQHIS